MPLIVKLAFRNVLRQRRRSILTALSMIGGYILCSYSFSLVDGSYANVIRIFTEDHTGHIQIHKGDYLKRARIYKTIDDQAEVERVLSNDPHVVSFAPRVYAPALAYAGEKNTPVEVIGVDTVREKGTSRLAQKVNDGKWLTNAPDGDGYFHALVGRGVADTLKLDTGSQLILISQGADGSIANDIFVVQGIVGTRDSDDKLNVYLPLQAAQEFLTLQGRVHEYAIDLDNIDRSREEATSLQQQLPDLTVSPWQDVEETFYKTMQSDKRGNDVTLGIVLFIVFIGVLNTVLMSVLERTREFGVLRAIGSRPFRIASLIALETCILAAMSIAVGALIAIPINAWFTWHGFAMPEPIDLGGVQFQYMLGEFNASVFVKPALILFAYAIGVSILPGIRAARISPTQAMRTY